MQTQTIKTELLINGQKVIIGHQFLGEITRSIPDIQENASVFDMLALSDDYEVREFISRNDNLSKKSIHILLNDENPDIVDNILSNHNLSKHIKEDVLFSIIKTGNIRFLATIASNFDDYDQCDLCKIAKKLASHKSATVRYGLVWSRPSEIISTKTLVKLSKDSDIDVSKGAYEEIARRNR